MKPQMRVTRRPGYDEHLVEVVYSLDSLDLSKYREEDLAMILKGKTLKALMEIEEVEVL